VQDQRLHSSFDSPLLHRLHLLVEVRPIDLRVAVQPWNMDDCDILDACCTGRVAFLRIPQRFRLFRKGQIHLTPMRSLVIATLEDDEAVCDLLEDFLTSEGHEVRTCRGADRAHEMVRSWQPDLVILDLWLGSRQSSDIPAGWSVFQELREDCSTASIPVILCSVDSTRLESCRESLKADVTVSCLDKPFDLEDFNCRIKQLVGSPR
jgi:CheY-like chemotaxis protein